MDLALASASPVEDNRRLMRHALKLHRNFSCPAVETLEVEVQRSSGSALRLRYLVAAKRGALRLPRPVAAAFADGLWRHTCFETFVRPGAGGAYFEFNFSPSGQWAAYGFDGYRSGMTALESHLDPKIETRDGETEFVLEAALDLGVLAGNRTARLGLSAVLEESDGRKSYWALAHPAGDPDFHHSDCFAAELPIAEVS